MIKVQWSRLNSVQFALSPLIFLVNSANAGFVLWRYSGVFILYILYDDKSLLLGAVLFSLNLLCVVGGGGEDKEGREGSCPNFLPASHPCRKEVCRVVMGPGLNSVPYQLFASQSPLQKGSLSRCHGSRLENCPVPAFCQPASQPTTCRKEVCCVVTGSGLTTLPSPHSHPWAV